MKDIFLGLKVTKKKNLVLLDSCFFINTFVHDKEKELLELCKSKDVALTSFTVEELLFVLPKIKEKHVKERISRFMKSNPKIFLFEVPIHPGNRDKEVAFVTSVNPYLTQDVPDPSDGVLVAAAILSHSIILTKDKHHLFTTVLSNYLDKYGLRVLKNFHEI